MSPQLINSENVSKIFYKENEEVLESVEKKLKRSVGLPMLVAIGLSSIIGSGIFMLPASLAATAGPAMLLSILFAGLIAAVLALAYAELGAAFPLTGGPFVFPRLALGELGGFLMGWGYFLYLFIGTAAIANIFVVYLGFYFPNLTAEGALTPSGIALALLFVWTLTALNIVGVKWGGLYAIVMTIARLIPLLLFCLIGISTLRGEVLRPFLPFGWKGVTVGVTLFFWSYTGFETVVVPSEEVKHPGKTIPRAILLTLLLTIAIYSFIGLAFLGMVKGGEWKHLAHLDAPLAAVAKLSSGRWLGGFIAIGALFATGGAVGSWILVQGRLPFAMARENLFWSKMGKVSSFGTPALSIIFSSLLTSVVVILVPHFVSISLIASITAVLPYAAAALSVPILRKTKKDVARPFTLKAPHLVALTAFILSTWLIYWAGWPWSCIGALLFFTGLIVFLFVRTSAFEWRRNLWLFVYLGGIALFSFVCEYSKCSMWALTALPYNLIWLSLFALIIYCWAYRSNLAAS